MNKIPGRRRWLFGAGGLSVLSILGYGGFLRAGRYLESAQQAPLKSDLIVCLGGDWGERSQRAAELYRMGYARHLLLTGALGLPQRPGRALPASRLQLLLDQGVPPGAILLDQASASSREEAGNTLTLMREKGWYSALVVSDPPHMRRLALLWGREFAGSGRLFRLVAASMPDWHPDTWWKGAWSGEFVRQEYLKLAYALLGGR